VPVSALVIGVVAALLTGTALGFEAHLLLDAPAKATPVRR
jgi:hypothetical protein